jgi:hypothetical protein
MDKSTEKRLKYAADIYIGNQIASFIFSAFVLACVIWFFYQVAIFKRDVSAALNGEYKHSQPVAQAPNLMAEQLKELPAKRQCISDGYEWIKAPWPISGNYCTRPASKE